MAKYPWGDDVFPMSVFFPMLFTIPMLVGLGLYATGNDAAVAADATPPLSALKGVALATCAWIAMIYTFFGAQVAMEEKDGEECKKIVERTMMNTLEQSPCFLLSMWLHALFVNPATSATLGFIYVVFRFMYGILYGLYGQFTIIAEVATVPNYAVIFWFLAATVAKCTLDVDMHGAVAAIDPMLVVAAAVGVNFVAMVAFFMVLPGLQVGFVKRGVAWEKGLSGKKK
jgi:hypothetical protein